MLGSSNRYPIDPESPAELARLLKQDLTTTRATGLFPPGVEIPVDARVLDIGCGPGGWVLEVAKAYSGASVTGLDISQAMIAYAAVTARVMRLSNTTFQVGDARQQLPFADNSFDVVSARLVTSFTRRDTWPEFVRECKRLLRPGGLICLTEADIATSNSSAYEQLCLYLTKALYRVGQGFAETRLATGVMLRRFLTQAGFEETQVHPSIVDMSYGTLEYAEQYSNTAILFTLMEPFLLKLEVIEQEEFNRLYEETLREMRGEDFCALQEIVTAWARKPERS